MWEFETEFSEIIPRTPQVKSFRFRVEQNAPYTSGQFFFLTIKVNGRDAGHHFSFSSSPSELGYIEFTKRITQSPFSQTLDRVAPGAWAHLKGPSGLFTLPEKKQKLAFLSGGIGITPLRSMLRFLSDRADPWDIVLLYGNSTYDDIAFREELDQYASRIGRASVVHVLSTPPAGWTGREGLINKDMVAEAIPDYGERLFYISGPPRMVSSLEEQVSALGVGRERLRRDSFTGYD